MKKLLTSMTSILLIIMMLLGMVACGGEGSGGDEPQVDSEGNTIVKIMFHVDKSSTEGQAYQKRINAFNAAYKDKKIKA